METQKESVMYSCLIDAYEKRYPIRYKLLYTLLFHMVKRIGQSATIFATVEMFRKYNCCKMKNKSK